MDCDTLERRAFARWVDSAKDGAARLTHPVVDRHAPGF
jgi:hypothetical protein